MKELRNIMESSILQASSKGVASGLDIFEWIQRCVWDGRKHPKDRDYTWDSKTGHIDFCGDIKITDKIDPTTVGVKLIMADNIELAGSRFSFQNELELSTRQDIYIGGKQISKKPITIRNLSIDSGDLNIYAPITSNSKIHINLYDSLNVFGNDANQSILQGPKDLITGLAGDVEFIHGETGLCVFDQILKFLHGQNIQAYIESLPARSMDKRMGRDFMRVDVVTLPREDQKEIASTLTSLDIINPQKNTDLMYVGFAELPNIAGAQITIKTMSGRPIYPNRQWVCARANQKILEITLPIGK